MPFAQKYQIFSIFFFFVCVKLITASKYQKIKLKQRENLFFLLQLVMKRWHRILLFTIPKRSRKAEKNSDKRFCPS